ncbi:MAG: PAS domain S-box protein [Candidatus Parcubacteria bacterium]|nr:PAS domain S-box protein [Burkholderiales bacterium]
MTFPDRLTNGSRNTVAPALARLLSDSSLNRAALAACGFPVALADACAKGRPLTYVNPAFEAFFGYRADKVLGRPVITLLFPEAEGASDMFSEAPARVHMRARCKDGASAEVELSIGMVHGVDGMLTHWVLAFADRGELQRLRDELRLLRALAASP